MRPEAARSHDLCSRRFEGDSTSKSRGIMCSVVTGVFALRGG
jgi:hypothetical protein